MRFATFNCENLFSRARLLNFSDEAGPSLELSLQRVAELDGLLGKAAYSGSDKARILDLANLLSEFAEINELRGRLFGTDPDTHARIVTASGRGAWIGGIVPRRADINLRAQENTARVIEAVAADVLLLVEVEDRRSVVAFNDRLTKPYPFALVLDGNDPRGIDVGILSRVPIDSIRTHIFERTAEGIPLFSRDCLEVVLKLEDGRLLTVLVNHLKSKSTAGGGDDASNDARRKLQADRVSAIAAALNPAESLVIVGGDFNDTPGSAPLQTLLHTPQLKSAQDMLDPAVVPFSERWTYRNKTQIDFLLLSKPLQQAWKNTGIERRGMFVDGVEHFDTVEGVTTSASDHAALWVDLDL